eukprot:scaffold56461_cov60-Phaeocystis_antarctica.AAC.7
MDSRVQLRRSRTARRRRGPQGLRPSPSSAVPPSSARSARLPACAARWSARERQAACAQFLLRGCRSRPAPPASSAEAR